MRASAMPLIIGGIPSEFLRLFESAELCKRFPTLRFAHMQAIQKKMARYLLFR
jgi:hypothetical protein